MVSSTNQNLVYNIRLSSVGPGRATNSDVVHELSGMDLAMKLHYLKGVYFFSSQASQGLTIKKIKETMFAWLSDYYTTCGRFRRTDGGGGRPYMKCNDCGARFIEAQCDKTVREWLEMKDCGSLHDLLVYHLPVGPELSFSPPLYIQVTNFKCGGKSLGVSWAHVLGDAYSATDFINMWGPFLGGLKSYGPFKDPKSSSELEKPTSSSMFVKDPMSLKQVNPVGDHWVTANNCKMETFSFHLTSSQVSHIQSKIWAQNKIDQIPFFESLCAMLWQSIAKFRDGHEPNIVTLCKKMPNSPKNGILSNSQIISSVKADFSIVDSDLKKLAMLLVDQAKNDESIGIEEAVEKENGVSDYIVYGANLTFVDLEEANLYGLEWNGCKPEFVHYTIQGIGDEGAVLVLPWAANSGKDDYNGRIVIFTLPENEVVNLKFELKMIGLLMETDLE